MPVRPVAAHMRSGQKEVFGSRHDCYPGILEVCAAICLSPVCQEVWVKRNSRQNSTLCDLKVIEPILEHPVTSFLIAQGKITQETEFQDNYAYYFLLPIREKIL